MVLAACTEGVKRAEKLIRPGALMCDVNNAAFEPYIETFRGRGILPMAGQTPADRSGMGVRLQGQHDDGVQHGNGLAGR